MYYGYLEEGDNCPDGGCKGKVGFNKVEGCACHIHPPCSACVNNPLTCLECGYEDESPPEKYVATEYAGLSQLIHKPRPLDKTKIDYRIEGHTHFTQKCRGVYPEGTTSEEVKKVVDGTFGGRFEQFGGGTFTFIAYTD